MHDLAAARADIRERRELHSMYGSLCDELKPETNVLTLRCAEPHRGNPRKLAEAALVRGHLMFKSRIEWMPSDMLNLRPWDRDHMEGAAMDDTTFGLLMHDDGMLERYLEQNDKLSNGVEPSGQRWLRKTGPVWVEYAFPLNALRLPTSVGLWVRCKDHPAEAERVDPLDLINSLR